MYAGHPIYKRCKKEGKEVKTLIGARLARMWVTRADAVRQRCLALYATL